MCRSVFCALCWALVVALAVADVRHRGSCPELSENATMADFQPSQFVGLWYAISSFGPGSTCITHNFTACGDGCLRVEEEQQLNLIQSLGLSNVYQREGLLQAAGDQPGTMRASYTDTPAFPEFRVLATDYSSFAAVYQCQNVSVGSLSLYHRRNVVVMHRERNGTLTPEQTEQLSETLIENQIEDESQLVEQTGCVEPERAAVGIHTGQLAQQVSQGVNAITNRVSNFFSGALNVFGLGQ